MDVTLSELAASLIALIEGNKLHAYQDSGGVWTIGIGHTKGVAAGMIITPEQSAAFFEQDQAPLLAMLAGMPILEAAALCSFGFNCGISKLERVLAGADLVSNPVHCTDRHGMVLAGLQNRRRFEWLLMALSQQMNRPPAPPPPGPELFVG